MKIHIDLDSFFVSAHRIKDKSLINKPVVVVKRSDKEIFKNINTKYFTMNKGAFTGDLIAYNKEYNKNYFLENGKVRGIVVTASYEARELGIKTGTTLAQALKIYPNLIVIAPNYKLYHLLSYKLKLFLRKKVPVIEQYSIDEFFGDLQGWIDDENIEFFIKDLKNEVWEKFSLPVSIGASKSKWIAKLATSFAKPNGIKVVRNVNEFIENIPINKFPGIGKNIEKKLKEKGIVTLGDVKRNKEYFYSWGKNGVTLYNRVCGIDEENVIENEDRKSIGISRRFDPVFRRSEVIRRVHILCRYLAFLITKKRVNPTFYYLKIKYKNGKKSKAHIKISRIFNELTLKEIMSILFYRADIEDEAIVSISLVTSRFKKESNLFDFEKDKRYEKLNEAIYKIRNRYGLSSIINANEII
ncbi:hypothetical protein JCM11957_05610 [Caminibacter profundus]